MPHKITDDSGLPEQHSLIWGTSMDHIGASAFRFSRSRRQVFERSGPEIGDEIVSVARGMAKFWLSESETFKVSINTTDAMLLQRVRSRGAGLIEPTQERDWPSKERKHGAISRISCEGRFPTAGRSVVRLRM